MPPNSRLDNDDDGDILLSATISPTPKDSAPFSATVTNTVAASSTGSGNSTGGKSVGIVDIIGTVTGIVLVASLVGYLMLYKQQNINYVFFLRNFIWVIAMLTSIFQDEVQYYATKWFGSKSARASARSHLAAASKPCTIEYNIQVQLVTGVISYCIGGAVLLLFDKYKRDESLVHQLMSIATNNIHAFSVGSNLTDYDQSYYTIKAAANPFATSLGGYLLQAMDGLQWSLGDDSYKYNELLFHVFSILASYHMFERFWWSTFCYPLEAVNNKHNTGLRDLESKVVFPLLLVLGLLLKNPLELIESLKLDPSTFHESIRSLLYGWIVFKISDFTYSWIKNNRTLTSYTYPTIIDQTELAQERILAEDHFSSPSMQVGSDREHNDIWNIYGNQYDVTEFVKHHPGGVESIMLAANRPDATAMFQSYHPFNVRKARAVLEKYRLDTTSNADTTVNKINAVTSEHQSLVKYGHDNDVFYDILCQRVAECLKGYKIDPIKDRGATWARLTLYVAIVVCNAFAFYKHCQGYVIWSVVFAFFGDITAAHIGHDGGHFAISRKFPRLNDVGVWGFFLISNPVIWQHQHTYAHHSYTNDEHKDPDLHHFKGLIKTRPDEDEGDFYFSFVKNTKVRGGRGYFWYIMLIFCQVTIGLAWWFPYVFIFDRSLHGVTDWSDRRQWHRTGQLILHWVLYTLVVVCVPFMVHENSLMALVQIFSHTFTASLVFALVTQVGHLADDALNTKFIDEQRKKRHSAAQNSWAAEQVVTSQDFNPQSEVMFFFGGGLSIQIEHHLFPNLNHCHLTKIQPIVEATCKEYNVSYKKYSTWSEAWKVATEYLTSLGKHD